MTNVQVYIKPLLHADTLNIILYEGLAPEFTASIIPDRKHAEVNLILNYFILFFREKAFITSAGR